MDNIELLAPVGDMLSLKCAVYNGANAVYLGLSNFNARIKADNFTEDNIAEVVRFAHLYNVKVYLTANTLVKNGEVSDFMHMIDVAYRAKVDAFIMQDFGMAMLVKKKYPNAVLHASTQMGIHNLQGAKMLQSLGYSRVVLSRETKLQDIIEIKKNTDLEIEYFVQGALCVAFSGNCYLSALKNGNSGNRGRCLQLCRLPYKAYKDGKLVGEKYYLSCKDLCLMNELDNLINAGVTSLKIEGRLKRASYVAQVVRSYRKLLDKKLNTLDDMVSEQKKIQSIFSRGEFNEKAYLYDNFNIINPDISNHEGRLIGSVVKVEKFKDIQKITLRLSEAISTNDVLRMVKKDNVCSIGVGNVNKVGIDLYEVFSTTKPEIGSKVYILKSAEVEDKLTAYNRRLPIGMHLYAKYGNKAVLTALYKDLSVDVAIDEVLQEAKSRPCTYDDVYKQVSKLNDTYFVLARLSCDMDNVFMPVSLLNELRRLVIEKLENAIIDDYNSNLPAMVINNIDMSVPDLSTDSVDTYIVDRVINEVERDSRHIITPSEYTTNYISDIVDKLIRKGVKKGYIYLDLPIVSTTSEMKKIEDTLSDLGVSIVINNYSQLSLARQYPAIAGIGMNVYNSYTACTLIDLGVIDFVQSLEVDNFTKAGIRYVCGNPALMTLCHCPTKVILGGKCSECGYSNKLELEDAKGNRYYIRRYRIDHCYFELISKEKYERQSSMPKLIDLRKI